MNELNEMANDILNFNIDLLANNILIQAKNSINSSTIMNQDFRPASKRDEYKYALLIIAVERALEKLKKEK